MVDIGHDFTHSVKIMSKIFQTVKRAPECNYRGDERAGVLLTAYQNIRPGTPREEFRPVLRQLVSRSCLSKPLVQNLSETFTLYSCQGMIGGIMNTTNSAIPIKGSKKPKRYLFILVYLFR